MSSYSRGPGSHGARLVLLASGVIPLAIGLAAARATASPEVVGQAAPAQIASASDYWTPERMRDAKPLPIPEPEPDAAGRVTADEERGAPAPVVSAPGAPPSVALPEATDAPGEWSLDSEVDEDALGEDALDEQPASGPAGPRGASATEVPTSVGTDGCHFSSGRLNPRTIDVKYPYGAVGKLFFTNPGVGDFVCSGAVIQGRVVATAGHCVHRGNGNPGTFFTNFLFCPAYRGGPSAKFGCWGWDFVTTTAAWATSGNVFPNSADFAMLVIQDRSINGVPTRIGDATGYFGYATGSLSANHVHMLGYPVGFSGGARMHQVAAGRCYAGGNNSERYGSDMRGGSSGGPWVQDFGRVASGQTVTSPSGPNLIVGIVSYSNVSTDPKYQGSSIPGQSFVDILAIACAQDTTPPANCN